VLPIAPTSQIARKCGRNEKGKSATLISTEAIARMRMVRSISARTGQLEPFTSCHDRPNASPADFFSSTITGTMKIQRVSRISPGTIRSTNPKAMPSAAMTPAAINDGRSG
jgi:hypothetical protein